MDAKYFLISKISAGYTSMNEEKMEKNVSELVCALKQYTAHNSSKFVCIIKVFLLVINLGLWNISYSFVVVLVTYIFLDILQVFFFNK